LNAEGARLARLARQPAPAQRAKTGADAAAPAKPRAPRAHKHRKPIKLSRGLPRLAWFIFTLNTFALLLLVASIVAADRSRMRLIDARKQELATLGGIFADALATSAIRDDATGAIIVNGVETPIPLFDDNGVDEILRNLVLPSKVRVRLFDYRGRLVKDSKLMQEGGQIDKVDLPPLGEKPAVEKWVTRAYDWWAKLIPKPARLPYREVPSSEATTFFIELARALNGRASSADRYSETQGLIVSVGVPVKPLKVTAGALLLTTEGGDIDAIARKDNEAVFRVVIASFIVSILLSAALGFWVARPIRRLAAAAEEAAEGASGTRVEIPDFSSRNDEIGELSVALGRMTDALYDRIEAIERFAADVSHEIKNPLTSIRSAVDTLQRAKKPEDQARLIEIAREDVRRLDRLITDISAASRLDAELARGGRERIDLSRLVSTYVEGAQTNWAANGVRLVLDTASVSPAEPLIIQGYEVRLAQVLDNLIANARSFSPPEGTIAVRLAREGTRTPTALLTVEDEGPGIPGDNLERIFERFYTSRPGAEFGKNSGLGLSISRQIVEAHGGRIWAENREAPATGARFQVRLPIKIEARV
jgi:two-component system sensor histidine kinase ChvG